MMPFSPMLLVLIVATDPVSPPETPVATPTQATANEVPLAPRVRVESVFTNSPTVLLLDTLAIVEGQFERQPNGDITGRTADGPVSYIASRVLFAGYSRVGVNDYLTRRAAAPTAPISPAVGVAAYNALATRTFPTRIQPILTNLCADCHARRDYPGSFKLTPIPHNHADPAAAADNLRVVLNAIHRADPSGSDFFAKFTTQHGNQREPSVLVNTHPVLKRVELWTHWVTAPEGTRELLQVPPRPPRITADRPASSSVSSPRPHDPGPFNAAAHAGRPR